MSANKNLLVLAHAPSPNLQALVAAVLAGCNHPEITGVTSRWLAPLAAQPEDILTADGLILGTPENLGYMSGALKDFFDRCYYPLLEVKQGLPFATFIRAGQDGTGTKRAIKSITTGLRWQEVQPPLVLKGNWQESFLTQAEELGTLIAAGLEAGVY